MNKSFDNLKKDLNEISFVKLEGYYVGTSMVIPISHITSKDIKLKSVLKKTMSTLIVQEWSYDFNKIRPNIVMFFYSHDYITRKDHLDSFQKVINTVINKNTVIGSKLENRITIKKLHLIFLLFIWFYQIRNVHTTFLRKCMIVLSLAEISHWITTIKKYRKQILTQTSLITLFDANMYENILVQYFKLNNLPTATLQHGHFNATSDNKQEIGIAFEGFVSDVFFAWGEYTKNEAIKNGINPDKVKCLGCPKHINYSLQKVKSDNHKLFGIVLDGGGEKTLQSNIDLIKISNRIAEIHNLKYVIRPHPVSDISLFDKIIDKRYLNRITKPYEPVEKYIETIDFSIATGSSVYSELIYLEETVFRFINDNNNDRYKDINWGTFRNSDDLLVLVDLYNTRPDYIEISTKRIKSILFASGDVTLNYYNAIKDLASLKKRK